MLDILEECIKLGCDEGTEVGEAEICGDEVSEVVGVTEGAVVGKYSTRL